MLEKIKRKPEYERERIAFLGAIFLTLFIVIVWSLFFVDLPDVSSGNTGTQESVSQPGLLQGFFLTIKEGLRVLLDEISRLWY